jgi:hypothetical protein
MSSIVIAGDTSGTITLSAPAVAGSNTISLPAVTGTILTTAYTGAVTFDGDFTVDTDTLHVDSTNNRVGIGKTNPTTALDVVGTVTATTFAGALTGNVTGDVSGNAGTVTNGVYTTDIGSTVQAYDADLTTLGGLSSADGNFIVGSATGWVVESGATVRTSLGLGTAATTASTDYATAAQGSLADSALQSSDIGSTVQAYDADTAKYDDTTANFTGTLQNGGSNVVVDTDIGSTVQSYDADLTTLGGLSSADGNFIVGSATGWVAESGATARTSLGLGSLATLSTVDAATITDNSVGAAELNVAGNGTSGQYLASDGDGTMTWTTLAAGGGFSNMDVITSTGTWTNPGSVTKIKVTVVGGGGAGASAYGQPGDPTSGGGGGAGGHAIEYISIPTSPVPVTIGAGGTTAPYPYPSPWVGTPGSTSSFGAYCSATGGVRGTNSAPGTTEGIGGNGGAGSGGLLNFTGRPGRPGYNGSGPTPANVTTMGAGGASIFGSYSTPNSNQGLNGNRFGPSYLQNGSPGGLYGNGGKANGSPRPTAGSYPTAGAPGVILVEY